MIPKLSTMTPEEKRVAIATACGLESLIGYPDERHIPKYLASLDACHEAEQTLTDEEQHEYVRIITGMHGEWCWGDVDGLHATASKKADAFLIAKGLATL